MKPAAVRGQSRALWRLAGHGDLLPPLALALVAALVFWGDLVAGSTFYGPDTLSFYYPLTSWFAAQLRSGSLPLWIPLIFGGYPLFADGEVGMLYPLHLLAYRLLPSAVAFVWLRPVHFWLAGLCAYGLGRLLGLRPLGALLAALTFGYGSFLVAHLQHENIIRSSVWLPLAIGALELALRQRGRRRVSWLLAGGVVLAIQMLGVHVQPVLLTLFTLAIYALFAPLKCPLAPARRAAGPRWRRVAGYLLERAVAVGVIGAIGAGLAAVQLLPLYQLGERSARAGGVSYEFSTSYSVPPTQLLQLILPYLFRPDQVSYWGLWSPFETTIYIGIAPLLLMLVSLVYLRTRVVLCFGILAFLGLVLSLGDYLPFRLYGLVWSLPGFSYLRVPGRFSLLFVLAGGMLAGCAADWLAGRSFEPRAVAAGRPRIRRMMVLALGFALGALLLGGLFALGRAWVGSDPGSVKRFIAAHYLSIRRGEGGLSDAAVYAGLLRSLDLGNPHTLEALAWMVSAPVLLLLRGRRVLSRRIWSAGLLALVIADLALFARDFYPRRPIDALSLRLPSASYLAEHAGLERVFVEPQLYSLLGPNQLVEAGVSIPGGYSSLEPRRATDYWWGMVRQDNVLLDLFNIRYVVAPRHVPGLASFDGTLFHPADRLMRGVVGNPSGEETFAFTPWWTEALTVVAAGEGLAAVPPGTPVAEITLQGDGREERLILRAGYDIDDKWAPYQGPFLPGARFAPHVAWAGPSFLEGGRRVTLSGATLPLPRPLMASQLTVRWLLPNVIFDLYGLGLHDRPGLPVRSLMPTDRAKYRRVYQDEDVAIYENRAALPRAFLAADARAAVGGGSVAQLIETPLDPRRTLLVDGNPPLTAGGDAADPGTATITRYQPNAVVVRVDARHPAYLVLADRYEEGWRAWVDGQEAPILRANVLLRAVPLAAGQHEVLFVYDPPVVRLGTAISLATALVVLGGGWWSLRPRRAAPPASAETTPRG